MPYPDHVIARGFKFQTYATADIVLNNANWTIMPSLSALILDAEAGDVLRINANGVWNNEAQHAYFDAATVTTGGVILNTMFDADLPAGGGGVQGWRGMSGQFNWFGAFFFYTVVAGDILSDGTVKTQLIYKTTGSKTLFANADTKFQWSVENIGPQAT